MTFAHRFTRRELLTAAAATAFVGCSTRQTTSDSQIDPRMKNMPLRPLPELDAALRAISLTPGRELSSIAALAMRGGQLVYENAVGFARIDASQNVLATPDSMYRIASISKMFVAIVVVKLADRGELDLDRDISDYLGYTLRNPHFPNSPISLRMLLSHTSSLRDAGGYNFPESVPLRDVWLAGGSRFGKGEMWAKNRAPGQYFSYCNFAFGMIATVMECASRVRFDRLMERELFTPLGVTATFDPASLSAAQLARVATLYRKRAEVNGRERWEPSGPWVAQVDDYARDAPKPRATDAYVVGTNGSVFGPQGGLRISLRDLGRTMTMLMNGGRIDGRAVLSERAVATLFSEQWRYSRAAFDGKGNRAEDDEGEGGLFNAWALGPQLFLDVSEGRRGDRFVEGGGFKGVGHLGNAYGLTSAFAFDPARRDGMIFLVGGTASDPELNKGRYSAMYRYEEEILTAIHRAAIG